MKELTDAVRQALEAEGSSFALNSLGLSDDDAFTYIAGLVQRTDLNWLSEKSSEGKQNRLLLLEKLKGSRAVLLTADFWQAVAQNGYGFLNVAYSATRQSYPLVAASLLVSRCKRALDDPFLMDIGTEVSSFLADNVVDVRNLFIEIVKALPQDEKRKLMSHLDMSLLAELDEDTIEHRAKGFFYDEESEQQKRDSKSKDIFAEVARRIERGDKPQ